MKTQIELENLIEEIFDKHTKPTGGGYEADYTDKTSFINELMEHLVSLSTPLKQLSDEEIRNVLDDCLDTEEQTYFGNPMKSIIIGKDEVVKRLRVLLSAYPLKEEKTVPKLSYDDMYDSDGIMKPEYAKAVRDTLSLSPQSDHINPIELLEWVMKNCISKEEMNDKELAHGCDYPTCILNKHKEAPKDCIASERKAVEQIEPDGWVTENKKFVSRQDYLERPDFYNLKTAKTIYFFPPIQEAEHKQGVKMLTYSEVEELADEHLKIASISKHEGHWEQWIEGFYNFYESLLSLPLKEEQKRLTDKDLLNLMGRFYFQLEKAKGDEVQQVYKVYATQFRSLLGEQRKEKTDGK